MKKIFIIVLSIIVALGVIFVATGLIITNGKNINIFAKEDLIERRIDEATIITSLKLSTSSDNIELYSSVDSQLHIEYWDSNFVSYKYNVNEGTAELKQQSSFKSWWQIRNPIEKAVKVYIPKSMDSLLSIHLSSGSLKNKDYIGDVETLKINVTSGEVLIEQCIAQNVDIVMTSGSIKIIGIEAENCHANLTSGKFTLVDSHISQRLNLDLTSGNAIIKNCDINTIKSKVTTGSMTTDSVSASSIDCQTTSGDITLKLKGIAIDYSIELKLTSGDALLSIGEQKMMAKNYFSWGSGANTIYCKSTSGFVKIYFDS